MLSIFNPLEKLAHGWQVLASLLLSAAVTALAYGLAESGLSEIAGTALSFYGIFVGMRLLSKVAASRATGHFAGTKQALKQFQEELEQWMNDRSILALFVIAVPVTLIYVLLRSACIAALGLFSSVWIAVSFGLAFGAVVASPILIRDLGRVITRDHHGPAQAQPASHYSVPQPPSAPQEAPVQGPSAPRYIGSTIDTGPIPTVAPDAPRSPYSPSQPHTATEPQESPEEAPTEPPEGPSGAVRAGTGGGGSTPL